MKGSSRLGVKTDTHYNSLADYAHNPGVMNDGTKLDEFAPVWASYYVEG